MNGIARIVLNNAQSVYDGGIIASILDNVEFFNNSNVKSEILSYATKPRLSGGYIAGLVLTLIWIIILCCIMIILCIPKCKKKTKYSPNESQNIGKRNRRKSSGLKLTGIFLLVFMGIMILFAFVLLCFFIINTAQLQQSIKKSPKGFKPNSTQPTAVLPSVKNSLFHLRSFLSTFIPNTRRDTAPITEEIIKHTLQMQKESRELFNGILMRKIGVRDTLDLGTKMTNIILKFFDISDNLIDNKTSYLKTLNDIFPSESDPSFSFLVFLAGMRKILDKPNCDETCKQYKDFFSQKFSKNNYFPSVKFATSFRYVMEQEKKNRTTIKMQTTKSKEKMKETMAKTERKMKARLNIPQSIRNMSSKRWDDMEVSIEKAVKMLDKFNEKLESDEIAKKSLKYSTLLSVLLVIPLLMILFAVIFFIIMIFYRYEWIMKFERHIVLSFYSSFGLVGVVLLITMLLFLYGGTYETELCRYLRTTQPVIHDGNSSYLVLDRKINKFIEEVIPVLKSKMGNSSKMDIPQPHNLLHGLIYKCRKNEPILKAIDVISSMSTKGLTDPKFTLHVMEVGRQIMEESLMELDPNKMMPNDTMDTLNQASRLDMFRKVDIDSEIRSIPTTPFFVSDQGVKKLLPIRELRDKISKVLAMFPEESKNLQQQFLQLDVILNKFLKIADNTKENFESLRNVEWIEPVVKDMRTSLIKMVTLANNKTELLQIANSEYERIIVASTPAKSDALMAKFVPRIMAVLGPCRPIYLSYRSVIDTVCDQIIGRINMSWVYLGTLSLILTMLLITGLHILTPPIPVATRSLPPHADNIDSGDKNINKNNNNNNILLTDVTVNKEPVKEPTTATFEPEEPEKLPLNDDSVNV